ncbi:MAG TPA: hypothetical protein VHI52_21180, partial [Verrucomicrobiae bacterium]|nr:hypothetical protein [Verrucomicrobiae bacterium]
MINKILLAGILAVGLVRLHAADPGAKEDWKKLKLLEIKGAVADRSQNQGWNLCRVKPQEGDEKEILLGNLPYDVKKSFDAWQANENPAPAR